MSRLRCHAGRWGVPFVVLEVGPWLPLRRVRWRLLSAVRQVRVLLGRAGGRPRWETGLTPSAYFARVRNGFSTRAVER